MNFFSFCTYLFFLHMNSWLRFSYCTCSSAGKFLKYFTTYFQKLSYLQVAIFTSMHNIGYFSNFFYCAFGRPYAQVVTPDKNVTIRYWIFGFCLLSIPQNERKIYNLICTFFDQTMFTFQFLNDKIHNYISQKLH